MKSFRSTGVMSALVVALAGYTYWEYRKAAEDGPAASDQEKKLFTLKNDEVQRIKLTRGSDEILLERENGEWKLKKPVEDQTEPTAMDAFLYSALGQKGRIFRGEDDQKTKNWAEFGLEPPGSVLEMQGAKKTETLAVSSKNAFDGSFYVRQGDELLLGDKGLAQAVSRDVGTLRSRHLWRQGDVDIERAEVELNSESHEKYALEKKGADWAVTPAPGFAVDSARVDQWVKMIKNLSTGSVVSESASEEDKRNDLLLKPSFVVTFHYKTADGKAGEWTLTAGQDKDEDVYLFTSLRPTIYKIQRSSLATLRVPTDYFRDPHKPFHFPIELAREIQVDHGAFHHKFKKADRAWQLADDSKNQDFEADQDKLVLLVQKLVSLEAGEFLPVKPFAPASRVVVRGDQGQTILDLGWGEEYKAKRPFNKGMTFRLAKTNLEKELLGISSEKLTSLIDPSLLKKKAESPKVEKK